jgi:hypothetical protein
MPRGGKRINFRKFGKVESYYAWVRLMRSEPPGGRGLGRPQIKGQSEALWFIDNLPELLRKLRVGNEEFPAPKAHP